MLVDDRRGELFQASFVGGLVVDALGLFNAMYVGSLLAALAIIIVAAFGSVITNRQSM